MDLYNNFTERCQVRKIEVGITQSKYLELRDEFIAKINWWKEVQGCIDWLYDRGLKKINANRLRNWANNSIKFQSEKERRNLEKMQKRPTIEKPKLQPLWSPPE